MVSTIIPVFNRPNLVVEAIESVLAQSYRPIEIIVIDDGSTDDTPEVVEGMQVSHPEIRLFCQANRGPGPARQTGLDNARGEFIQFLDSDDLLDERKFDLQVQALREHPAAGIAYGPTRFMSQSGEVLMPWLGTGERHETLFPAMLARRFWATSSPLYRKSLFDCAGRFSSLLNEEDWEMDCRIAAKGCRLVWVDDLVSTEREIAESRASRGGSTDPAKLRDRARAREAILRHAVQAGVLLESKEFAEFSRSSFLVARQCALAGLAGEAEHLVRRLNETVPRMLMRMYLMAGYWLGFSRATFIAESTHRLFHSRLKDSA